MSKLKRTERGWGGHYILSNKCLFRRNTLLEFGDVKLVISTVGNLYINEEIDTVGANRYAETMAFYAKFDGHYWDADVTKELKFSSPWAMHTYDDDNKTNDMHEAVVSEFLLKIMTGELIEAYERYDDGD